MAKDRYAPKTLDDVMSGLSGKLKAYEGKSLELSKFQRLLESSIGGPMAQKCQVSNYRDNILIITADSAAVAMRLNYMKMGILTDLRKNGLAELSQVKVQTNPKSAKFSQPQIKISDADMNHRCMSDNTANSLLEVAEHAPPSLKAKLEKLARHRGKNIKN